MYTKYFHVNDILTKFPLSAHIFFFFFWTLFEFIAISSDDIWPIQVDGLL